MNKTDAAKLVSVVCAAYPNFDKFNNPDEVRATVNLWAMMFEGDDGALVGLAVKKHIATSKWPPSVAEIRENMLEMTAPDLIPPDRAWEDVAALFPEVSMFAERDQYECRLAPLVCRAVDAIGWRHLLSMHRDASIGEKAGMDRVAFIQQYTPMYEREKHRAMTPGGINAQIDHIRELKAAELPQPEPKKKPAAIPAAMIEALRESLAQ